MNITEIETTWEHPEIKSTLNKCLANLKAAKKNLDFVIDTAKNIEDIGIKEFDWSGFVEDWDYQIRTAQRGIEDALRGVQDLKHNEYGEAFYDLVTIDYPDDFVEPYTPEAEWEDIKNKLGYVIVSQDKK